MAVQAETATVTIVVGMMAEASAAVQAGLAVTVVAAQKVIQGSVAAQASTAIARAFEIPPNVGPNPPVVLFAPDTEHVLVGPETEHVVFVEVPPLYTSSAAVQAGLATVAFDVDAITQSAVVVQAATATTSIDGTVS